MSDSIDCREAALRLYDYLKRELTLEMAAEMQAHLTRCRHCFTHARFEENFLRMLEACAARQRCPGTLRARIVTVLEGEAERD